MHDWCFHHRSISKRHLTTGHQRSQGWSISLHHHSASVLTAHRSILSHHQTATTTTATTTTITLIEYQSLFHQLINSLSINTLHLVHFRYFTHLALNLALSHRTDDLLTWTWLRALAQSVFAASEPSHNLTYFDFGSKICSIRFDRFPCCLACFLFFSIVYGNVWVRFLYFPAPENVPAPLGFLPQRWTKWTKQATRDGKISSW